MARGENVFYRKDGRYEARYIKGRRTDGKPLYGFCYGRTYEEAKRKADEARENIGLEKKNYKQQGDVSYFCDSWLLANSSRLKPSSCAKYQADIENHIKPFFGDKLPCEILPEAIDAFTQMLLTEKKLAPKTVRSILTLLHSLLAYMKKRAGEKLGDLEITYPKNYRKETRILDEKEEATLVQYLAQDMDSCKFGIYLALRTGMRIGEVCALRWCDISFHTATISVCRTAQRLPRNPWYPMRDMTESVNKEKMVSVSENSQNMSIVPDAGTIESTDTASNTMTSEDEKKPLTDTVSKEDFRTSMVVGSPKSESSVRIIPLMTDIAALCKKFSPENPKAFLLTGTEKCMDPRKLQRHLKKYLEKCDIEEVHFHTLRHTFATRCVEAGFDVKTLSEILGHSNISITMNLYVHPNLDLKRENMNRLKPLIPLEM